MIRSKDKVSEADLTDTVLEGITPFGRQDLQRIHEDSKREIVDCLFQMGDSLECRTVIGTASEISKHCDEYSEDKLLWVVIDTPETLKLDELAEITGKIADRCDPDGKMVSMVSFERGKDLIKLWEVYRRKEFL